MKPGFTALTTAYAALIARPESPPLESTSSWTNVAQSATTFGRVPGTVRISFSVGMAGNLHHHAPPWYAWRDGPVPSVATRDPRGADGPESPELPGSLHPGGGPARHHQGSAPVGRGGRLAADVLHSFLRRDIADIRLAGRSARAFPVGGDRCAGLERGDARIGPGHLVPHPGRGANGDRHRRGELHGGDAFSAVRLLPARSAWARARDLLRRDPGRDGRRIRAGRAARGA